MTKQIVVLGSGGHAKVVVATAAAAGFEVVAVYDDNAGRLGHRVLGAPVRGGTEKAGALGLPAVIAIGDNRARHTLARRLNLEWATLVHPQAVVHESVSVGSGSVIFAGVIVQPDSVLGAHVVLNTGCSVDHDCVLGDAVHIGPGARLCGGVNIGEGTLMGVASAVISRMNVGDWCVVGGGATVVRNQPSNAVVTGVPARPRSA